jgi:hypothetical protein
MTGRLVVARLARGSTSATLARDLLGRPAAAAGIDAGH